VYGKLPAPAPDSAASVVDRFAAAAKRAASMSKAAPRSALGSAAAVSLPPIVWENVLVWDVMRAMDDQVDIVPLGGVYAFKYTSLEFVFKMLVPPRRQREVFEQFLILKPYAINKLSGRDGRKRKGDDDHPPRSRRR
jgi:hypothetical protein